jgi:hypothetical protein
MIKISLKPEYAKREDVPKEIEAQVVGDWAAHDAMVTHVPTGRSVTQYLPSNYAALVLAHALDVAGVRIPADPSKTPKRTVARVRAAVRAAQIILNQHGTLEFDVARVVREILRVR